MEIKSTRLQTIVSYAVFCMRGPCNSLHTNGIGRKAIFE